MSQFLIREVVLLQVWETHGTRKGGLGDLSLLEVGHGLMTVANEQRRGNKETAAAMKPIVHALHGKRERDASHQRAAPEIRHETSLDFFTCYSLEQCHYYWLFVQERIIDSDQGIKGHNAVR